MLSPGDFWVASGHHLCDLDEDGRLRATPDLWRAFLARPELLPPPEACDAERALHARLLQVVGAHRVGDRPDRVEPRARKRRPKHGALLTKPRNQTRAELLKGVRA